MRSVILAALLVVACNGLANFMPLSGVTITNSKLTVTGQADNVAGWDIVGVVAQTGDYNADGTHPFALMFNITFTGTLVPASLNYWDVILTVAGPGGAPNSANGGTCNTAGIPAGYVTSFSSFTQYSDHLYYAGPTGFALTATGAYTATIALYTYGTQRDTATFQFNVGTAYTLPTKVTPTFSTFTVGAAANGSASTPTINAVLDSTQINAGDSWSARVTFANGAAPSAVAWGTSSGPVTTGTFATWSPLSAGVGYWCGNRFVSGLGLSGATFPQNTQINTQSATVTRSSPAPVVSNSFTPAGQSFTATSGSTDTTAPACTAAAFAAASINTQTGGSTVGVTTTCTDANLAFSGVFIHGTSQNGHQDAVVFNNNNYNVPLFQTGEANIIGVWAIDQTGNAVVYGDCGDNAATWATMCGGGSSGSSALVASFAVVMMCIAAVLAL